MANANIDALYVGSLRIKKKHVSFPSNFTFYKRCVIKVAHCIFPSVKMYAALKYPAHFR